MDSRLVKNRTHAQQEAEVVPAWATLDGFAGAVSTMEGLSLNEIEPLTTLLVETRNSVYRIIVSAASNVLVQGGRFFPEITEAHLSGSGFGGSFLKLAWIGVGLCMEICSGGQRIITSPVRAIHIELDPSVSSPQ